MKGIRVRVNIGGTDNRFLPSIMPLSLAYFALLVYPGLPILDIERTSSWILIVQRITKLSDNEIQDGGCELIITRYLEIIFILVVKGSLTRSKILNTHALCSQNIHFVPTDHVQ
jgi:hypothetical protein